MNFNDSRMEAMMGRLLQVGVLAAGFLMLVGGAWYLWLHGLEMPHYGTFRRSGSGPGQPILYAAVIVMIATPVLRVVFAVVGFAIERDWLYAGVSLVVLGILGWALFG
jgi:uncharacterized membrane protein